MMQIDNKFKLGQRVYVIHDPDGNRGMVTAVQKQIGGGVYYMVNFGLEGELFSAQELSELSDNMLPNQESAEED